MIPDFGGLLWMFITIIVVVVFAAVSMVFLFVVMPPISRQMIKAKWSKGVPAFIEDDAGNVNFTVSTKKLPEGLIKNKEGWFLLPRPAYMEPPTQKPQPQNPDEPVLTEEEQKKVDKEKVDATKTILRVPILRGLGKQTFFGYAGAALLTNLKTLAHADLRRIRELVPVTIQKSHLDGLATWARLEGAKMVGQDTIKIIVVAIAVVGVIVTVGLTFWFLSGGFT